MKERDSLRLGLATTDAKHQRKEITMGWWPVHYDLTTHDCIGDSCKNFGQRGQMPYQPSFLP